MHVCPGKAWSISKSSNCEITVCWGLLLYATLLISHGTGSCFSLSSYIASLLIDVDGAWDITLYNIL